MVRWNIAGADVIPNGIRVYSNRLLWVLITRCLLAESSNWSCEYAWDRSSFEKETPPAIAVKMSSLRGIGCVSQTIALFADTL